jgi:hypothetical protein
MRTSHNVILTSKPLTDAHLDSVTAFAEKLADPEARVEFLQNRHGFFVPLAGTGGFYASDALRYRLAPAPPTPPLRPWTETEAAGKLIKQKDSASIFIITEVDGGVACFGNGRTASLERLLAAYERLDGKPCGELVEP